jgi:hypothetical protein
VSSHISKSTLSNWLNLPVVDFIEPRSPQLPMLAESVRVEKSGQREKDGIKIGDS